MVKINGMSAERRNMICDKCGARLRKPADQTSCPNVERADHNGLPYAGGANLSRGGK